MDLNLTTEQQQLVEAFGALYARECTSERVRAAEPTGFDDRLWQSLQETGAIEMAVDEAVGGGGASMLDLALVAEQHGRVIAPAPLIETQIALRLLAVCAQAGSGPAADMLAKALAGDLSVTFAPRPARAGRLGLVPAGAVADAVVALVDHRLVVVDVGTHRTPISNLAAMPLADVVVHDPTALCVGDAAGQRFSSALDEWLTLTAAALVGIGSRGLELGAAYAVDRHAFGVPIGSFQAVSHRLADCATAIDGARLLAYRAACAFDDEPDRATELAAMAFFFAYESARDATHRSLHVHGGYGFMMEQDIQLYYRRARGWANVFAGPREVLDRIAHVRYG